MKAYFKFAVDQNGIAELILNDEEEKVNMLKAPMLLELKELLNKIESDHSIKAMVIKSAKKDIFIAGADIHEISGIQDENEANDKSRQGQEIMTRIQRLPFPTVSVIDGACLGGGLEVALATTYRIVSDNKKTQLGLPEVTLGIIPGFGGTYRLPRLIGLTQALPMILTGRPVDGMKAVRIKLADAIYPSEFLEDRTREFIQRILTPSGRLKILRRRGQRKLSERFLNGTPVGKAAVFSAAGKDLMKKTRGFYPAPLAALGVIRRTYGRSLDRSMKIERKAFAKLAVSPISKNLIRIYFTSEALKKDYVPKERIGTNAVGSLALLGAGKMGGGIAWLASSTDIPVRMKDVNWEALGNGYAAVHEIYEELLKIKKLSEREAELKRQQVTGTVDYSGFMSADFIIEAIVEDQDIKMKAYRELEEHIRPDAIIATNTSSLSVNQLSRDLKHPECFIGFHFFNPVNRMPLIEIIPGEKTSPETFYRAVDFARKLKKTPVVVQDCHGFLVNRILMAYLNESLLMLEEGIDFTRIDQIMLDFGMPMGPFELLDEIGIKVGFKVAKILAHAYPERSKAGRLFDIIGSDINLIGKSSGVGFYLYQGKNKTKNPEILKILKDNRIKFTKINTGNVPMRALLRMINEAALCLQEGIIGKAEYLDMAMILGTGFPAFRGGILKYADDLGIDNVFNLLIKYEKLYGGRFKPADFLRELNGKKGRFYEI